MKTVLPAPRATRGILELRTVTVQHTFGTIGKESNLLEEVETGLVRRWDEAREIYDDQDRTDGVSGITGPERMAHGKLSQTSGLCAVRSERILQRQGNTLRCRSMQNFKALPQGYARAHLGPDARRRTAGRVAARVLDPRLRAGRA